MALRSPSRAATRPTHLSALSRTDELSDCSVPYPRAGSRSARCRRCSPPGSHCVRSPRDRSQRGRAGSERRLRRRPSRAPSRRARSPGSKGRRTAARPPLDDRARPGGAAPADMSAPCSEVRHRSRRRHAVGEPDVVAASGRRAIGNELRPSPQIPSRAAYVIFTSPSGAFVTRRPRSAP